MQVQVYITYKTHCDKRHLKLPHISNWHQFHLTLNSVTLSLGRRLQTCLGLTSIPALSKELPQSLQDACDMEVIPAWSAWAREEAAALKGV